MSEYEAYFDESGDLTSKDGVEGVAGYYMHSDSAREMERLWRKVLTDHDLAFFHTKDCGPGNRQFRGKPESERIEIQTKLIELIKRYTIAGVSIFACADELDANEDAKGAYKYCTESALEAVRGFLKVQRIEGPVAYFFEAGKTDRGGEAKINLASLAREGDSVSFGGKTDFPLLQAADILAWHTRKYIADGRSSARKPRQDLLSLFEHTHDLYHISKFGRGGRLAVEAWPLQRRSAFTSSMTSHDEGPLHYLIEDGSETPILPVHMSLGSGLGAGRMIQVFFRDIRGKDFSLAFDEAGVAEAAHVLRMAAEIYGAQASVSILVSQGLAVDRRQDHVMLAFDLGNLTSVNLPLPFHAAKQLLDELTRALGDGGG